MKNSLLDVVTAIRLSKATIRNIKENLFWAFFITALEFRWLRVCFSLCLAGN